MAYAQVHYQISENEVLLVDIGSEAESPDALDDVVTRAGRLFRQSLDNVYEVNPGKQVT